MCVTLIASNNKEVNAGIDYSRHFIARGMFYVTPEGIKIAKEKFAEENMPSDANFAIIHCRQPTQGSPKKDANNHPWAKDGLFRYVVGCQVGYTNYRDAHRVKLEGECDSELAIHMLANLKNPWPWIEKNVVGQLFFWAGENEQNGKFYCYGATLKKGDEGASTLGISNTNNDLLEIIPTQDGFKLELTKNIYTRQ